MPHRFVVMVDGEVREYADFDQIPLIIEHVIEFAPEVPPPPHTDAEHDALHDWEQKFDELMIRENDYASSSEKR
jgi:hypothetical protein